MNLSNISVILPSLDPDEKLLAVVNGLLDYGFSDIILVNDGSKAENLHYFETAALHPQVHLLHHPLNLGKGAALKTAFCWFLENRPDAVGVVTVDGDNQHHPEDTRACALRMQETGKVVLGARNFQQADIPARSRFGNNVTCGIFKIFVGMKLTDTQTGLRAIPRSVLEQFAKIPGDRFEYETNMLLFMKVQAIAFEEIKIRTVYIEENKSSHFRAIRDSWRIYKLILSHFFKYAASSLFCSFLDEGLHMLLTALLCGILFDWKLSAVTILGARLVSSLVNFFLNKRVVFHSTEKLRKSFLKYYAVAAPIAILQLLGTEGIYRLLNVSENLVFMRAVYHMIVMTALYFVSFLVQQRWVFTQKKN